MRTEAQARIRFPVPEAEEGYPPVDTEYLWCTQREDGRFIVDNIPFYARDISLGDVVEARKENDELVFQRLVELSPNTTVRVFARDMQYFEQLVAKLESIGCDLEGGSIKGHLAVSAPRDANLQELFDFLDVESAAGKIAFEESAVRYK